MEYKLKRIEKHPKPSDRTLFCYMVIDNFDDISDQLSAGERSALLSHVATLLTDWAATLDAVILNTDSDHYVMTFNEKHLSEMEADRFSILDRIRETAFPEKTDQNPIHVTLSMGIGVSDQPVTISEADALSHSALEFALARGGDQCVVRRDDAMSFYGGKSEASERRTKVKARVKAHALRESILNADNVLIMGHQTPDMDCIAAAVGLMGACRTVNKDCRFVLKEINYSIAALVDYLSRNEYYENAFLKPDEVNHYLTDNTLLIIVDTQNPNYVEIPELLTTIRSRVLIDHHRRSGKGIEGTLFSYVESYASSTSELVTELLQYFNDKSSGRNTERPMIGKMESNALMAGICMDTKMFSIKTGVRTFEAAAFLKRRGADTVIAKTLLQSDLETYAAKSDAVRNAHIYQPLAAQGEKPHIAISTITDSSPNAKIIAAQAADELLNIKNISASFIILKYTDCIVISGRSMGAINVQLILEKLGGGGHLTIAGAQLYDVTDLHIAKDMLIDAIETFYQEKGDN